MKKSKKGVTLVELIICCGILVMLGGACTAVLASGSQIFNQSSAAAKAQMDADVMQNHIMAFVPSATAISQKDPLTTTLPLEKGNCIYFDNEGVFTISRDGVVTAVDSVSAFEYEVVPAGDNDSTNVRSQFLYTVSFKDGTSLSGGFVMNNIKFKDAKNIAGEVPITGNITDHPLCFTAS